MEENRDKTAVLSGQFEDHPASPEWYEIVSFQDAKTIIRANLATAARSFIAIGFYLKHIRDKELYREDGFGNIWEFAQAEYGISKSTASRYMAMNDRFSEGGNTPLIQEQYKQFNKSQLQEMLSLDEEQLGKVTPADRVEDIRAMRKPREVPYIELPGQIELKEFPGIVLEEAEAYEQRATVEAQRKELPSKPYTVTLEQLMGEDGAEETVARSQQEESNENSRESLEGTAETAAEQLSAYGTPKRMYPPDSLIAVEGCEGGHDCFLCAMDCQIRGKERHCREAPTGNPFSCEIVKGGFTELPESCQFVNHDLAEHYAGSGEPDPCCKNCQEPCEYICGRAMKALDQAAVILEADQESTQDEKDLDESYNLGDLPQVRDKYLDELAVAPLAGAWIEMFRYDKHRLLLRCRSPCGSVD